MRKHLGQIILLVILFATALILAYFLLPYSPKHLRQLEAVWLKNSIKEWKMLQRSPNYGITNKAGFKIFVVETNITHKNKTYKCVLRLESPQLQKGTYLIGTEDMEVFWCNEKGCEPVE